MAPVNDLRATYIRDEAASAKATAQLKKLMRKTYVPTDTLDSPALPPLPSKPPTPGGRQECDEVATG